MDWKALGLKCGLEIHQQLNTNKLFCDDPSILREKEPDFTVERKLRAVAGEMGARDVAAMAEQVKDKVFVYEGYNDSTCLVEVDEEPPHLINQEALTTSIQISKLFQMTLFDEIQVMRKTVIDGSNASGFQRTALISEDGFVKTKDGRVRIATLALEEDAARRIKEIDNKIYFRLDRLGIPLVEIMTLPDIKTPEQAKEAAEQIGLLLRMTGNVKRGLGTIRQDVNVSIKGGSRVEIKGVQRLDDIPHIIENEVKRQQALLEVLDKLKSRGARPTRKIVDVSKVLKTSASNLIKKAFNDDQRIFGAKLTGFAGLLKKQIQGELTLAKDIVSYLKVFTNLKGFIHRDELPGYGISENETSQLALRLECRPTDAFVFVVGSKEECEHGLNVIFDRAEQHLKGVPSEVRAVNPDNTTRFLRPMPGAARMYPETDHPPIKITKQMIKEIKLPELPEKHLMRFKEWGLSDDLAKQMLRSEEMMIFEGLVPTFKKIAPTIIANTLLSARDEIRKRYSTSTENLTDDHFKQTFELLNSDQTAKEALIDILAHLAKHSEKTAEQAMKDLNLKKISKNELEKIIDKTLAEQEQLAKDKQFKMLMGFVMRRVRGRIDGELVAQTLKEKLGLK